MNNKSLKFVFKATSIKKERKATKTNKKISRLCLGKVVKEQDTYKVEISTLNTNTNIEVLCVPLTEQSLSLKDKTHVFYHKKDEHDKHIIIIRDEINCHVNSGTEMQYNAVIDGCIIAGHIVNINNKFYFDYKQLVALNNRAAHINPVKIDDDKPLF